MRARAVVLFGSCLLILACHDDTPPAPAKPVVAADGWDRIAALDAKPPSGFTCDMRLDSAGASVQLVADVALQPGNYLASPFSPDTVLGHFRFEITEGDLVLAEGMHESPTATLTFDPQLNMQVRYAVGSVRYAQPVLLPEGPFKASGEAFFVLEPACQPRVLPFDVWRDGTGLHLAQRPGC